jgi:hypothetical protein
MSSNLKRNFISHIYSIFIPWDYKINTHIVPWAKTDQLMLHIDPPKHNVFAIICTGSDRVNNSASNDTWVVSQSGKMAD